MVGFACTKETPVPLNADQPDLNGLGLPFQMKGVEVKFYENLAQNNASCEGLFAVLTDVNADYVIEITNLSEDPLIQGLEFDGKKYWVDFEFLDVSYTCMEEYRKSGSPKTDPVIQIFVEQALISRIQSIQ